MAQVVFNDCEILVEKGSFVDPKWIDNVLEIDIENVTDSKLYENARLYYDYHGVSVDKNESRQATTEEILNGLLSIVIDLNNQISQLKKGEL